MSTATRPSEAPTFADFGVEASLCEALADAGIITPFPIQELTLHLALSGADIIGQARTGTGKTLAFGLPMLQRLDPDSAVPQGLVIVPTRELCLQVADDIARAGSRKGVAVVAVYGGRALEPQINALRKGAPIVVGTPGRLLDLKGRGVLDLSTVNTLVLDEADEMLDLGFLPDVEQLIEGTASQRQTLLFSATMPPQVVALARRYMSKPTFLRADVEEARIGPETQQHFFSCHRLDKPAVLARILESPERGLCVVFVRTKRMADTLAAELRDRGIDAAPIHSDLRQEARERALDRFRKGKIDVLVATEVAARGLDIDDVTHVVNYDCPEDEKMYLHRIGRTGRAGATGVAITLALWNELPRVEMIKRALEIDAPTHEVFSTSDVLGELFDLPPRTGRAPRAITPDATGRGGRGGKGRGGKRQAEQRDDQRAASGKRGTGQRETAARATDEPGRDRQTATRRRVRRRGGTSGTSARDSGQRAATSARDAETGHDEAHAPAADQAVATEEAPATAGGRTRTRVRTRTRQRTEPSGERRSPREPEEQRTGGRDQSRQGDRLERATPPAAGDQERSPQAGSRRRGGRSRRARGRGGQRGSQPTQARTSPRTTDLSQVRGDGQPALRRPMEIRHLP